MLAVTGIVLRACEAPEGSEQDTDWTWFTLKENSLGPLPSGLILGGHAWKQRHQESHLRCWQQQQRWRERDKFNRHVFSQDGRTCWWTSVGKKRTGEPHRPAWVAGCGWGHEVKEMQEPGEGCRWQWPWGPEREETSCDTQETCPRCPEPRALAPASGLKPSPVSDPAILDPPCLLRSSSWTLRSLYKKCQRALFMCWPGDAEVTGLRNGSCGPLLCLGGSVCPREQMGTKGDGARVGTADLGGGDKVWKCQKEGYGEGGAARAKAATPHGWDK